MNIVFAGTPAFSLPSLNALYESGYHLKAVYTQPDRPANRGQKLQPSAVKTWALEHQIPIYQPVHFKTHEDIETFQSLNPDLFIVIAYGIILPRIILETPKWGCINVHASLLPRWRGASPIQSAILNGDEETGITIMQMDTGMDTGNILAQTAYTIKPNETAGSLQEVLAHLAPKSLLDVVAAIPKDKLASTPQNSDDATYAPKIQKEEAHLDWNQTATAIDRKIRAFNPWPIAYTFFDDQLLKIHQASILNQSSTQMPGTIIDISKKGIIVETGHHAIRIEQLQFAGGKLITADSFFNAHDKRLHVGQVLK